MPHAWPSTGRAAGVRDAPGGASRRPLAGEGRQAGGLDPPFRPARSRAAAADDPRRPAATRLPRPRRSRSSRLPAGSVAGVDPFARAYGALAPHPRAAAAPARRAGRAGPGVACRRCSRPRRAPRAPARASAAGLGLAGSDLSRGAAVGLADFATLLAAPAATATPAVAFVVAVLGAVLGGRRFRSRPGSSARPRFDILVLVLVLVLTSSSIRVGRLDRPQRWRLARAVRPQPLDPEIRRNQRIVTRHHDLIARSGPRSGSATRASGSGCRARRWPARRRRSRPSGAAMPSSSIARSTYSAVDSTERTTPVPAQCGQAWLDASAGTAAAAAATSPAGRTG